MSPVQSASKLSDTEKPPPAFSIVDVSVFDTATFEKYIKGHWETVEQYGGTFLVAGGKFETIEGNWRPNKIVIHQWPSVEAFHRWHDSEDYRPWRELRFQAASADVTLVEGLEDSSQPAT
jgi:uncharacterized protein (DUF1330 family)